jgi:DNA-binding transcriptional LysR family regulator
MRTVHVDQVDLNLIPALVALLDERHVSRAAERVKLSQPAMSRALQRLRRTLDDELLVRGPAGYDLTSRAESLRVQLADIVPRLEQIFAAAVFDPAQAEQTFRVVGSDYAVMTFGASLFRRVLEQSPRSSLCFENWRNQTFDELDDGRADLVFYGAPGPGHLRHERLFTDHFVCIVSDDHPLSGKRSVALSDYLAWPHLVVSIDHDRQPAIDDRLDELGQQRRPGLILPFHVASPTVVRGTPLIATIPHRLLVGQNNDGIAILRAPREIDTLRYFMTWSPRHDRDPAHEWLRQIVRSCRPSSDASRSPGPAERTTARPVKPGHTLRKLR